MKSQLNLSQKGNQNNLNDHKRVKKGNFIISHFKSFINLNSWGGFLVKGLKVDLNNDIIYLLCYIFHLRNSNYLGKVT